MYGDTINIAKYILFFYRNRKVSMLTKTFCTLNILLSRFFVSVCFKCLKY